MKNTKFMTPKDKFKELWNDPARVRLAIEAEDVSVAQVAEMFFEKGYYFAKETVETIAKMLYDNSISGNVFVPPGLEMKEIYAVAAKALLLLVENMDNPLPLPLKESMH
jgi:hypothetical protein